MISEIDWSKEGADRIAMFEVAVAECVDHINWICQCIAYMDEEVVWQPKQKGILGMVVKNVPKEAFERLMMIPISHWRYSAERTSDFQGGAQSR